MRLAVKIDTSAIEAGLRDMPRNIPFAISLAMNLVAKDVVPVLRSDIQRVFTIRNNWEALGIAFRPASKRDLSVEIGSRHDYMVAQVIGGEKRAKKGSTVGVPLVGPGKPRPRPTSVTKPAKHPKALIAVSADRAFAGTVPTKKGPVYGVWRRVWRSKSRGKIVRRAGPDARPGLSLLYELEKSVTIPRRWPLQEQVTMAWGALWPRRVRDALEKTIRHSVERGAKKGKWER